MAVFALLGCHRGFVMEDGHESSLTPIDLNQMPDNFDQINAEAQLAEAAAGVSRTLNNLAAMQRASHPEIYKNLPDVGSSKQTSGIATVHYVGPVEGLLEKIAKKTGLVFITYGQKTATPIIVSIDAVERSLETIIQDISYQAQNHAYVKVNAPQNRLELVYINGYHG
jgi:hypothetical protein